MRAGGGAAIDALRCDSLPPPTGSCAGKLKREAVIRVDISL